MFPGTVQFGEELTHNFHLNEIIPRTRCVNHFSTCLFQVNKKHFKHSPNHITGPKHCEVHLPYPQFMISAFFWICSIWRTEGASQSFPNQARWTVWIRINRTWDLYHPVSRYYCFNARLKPRKRIDITTTTSFLWYLLCRFDLYVGYSGTYYWNRHEAPQWDRLTVTQPAAHRIEAGITCLWQGKREASEFTECPTIHEHLLTMLQAIELQESLPMGFFIASTRSVIGRCCCRDSYIRPRGGIWSM